MPHTEDHIEENETVDETGLQDDTSSTNNVDGIQTAALAGASDTKLEITGDGGLGSNFTGSVTNFMPYGEIKGGLQTDVNPDVLRGVIPAPAGFEADERGGGFLRPDYFLAAGQGRFDDAAAKSFYKPLQPGYFQARSVQQGDMIPSKDDPNIVFRARGPGKGGFDVGLIADYEDGKLTSGYELPKEFTDFMNKPVDPNQTTMQKLNEAESAIAKLPDVAPTNNVTEITKEVQDTGAEEGGLPTDTGEPVVTTTTAEDTTEEGLPANAGSSVRADYIAEPSPDQPVELSREELKEKLDSATDTSSREFRIDQLVYNGMDRAEAESIVDGSIEAAERRAERLPDTNKSEVAVQVADKVKVQTNARNKAVGKLTDLQAANKVNDSLIRFINAGKFAPPTDLDAKRKGEGALEIKRILAENEISLGDFNKEELKMLSKIFGRYLKANFRSEREEIFNTQLPLLIDRNRSRVANRLANTQALQDQAANLEADAQLTVAEYSKLEQDIVSGKVTDDESLQKYFDESKRRTLITNRMSKEEQGKRILNATRFIEGANALMKPEFDALTQKLKDNPADEKSRKRLDVLTERRELYRNYYETLYLNTTYKEIFANPDAYNDFVKELKGQGLLETPEFRQEITSGQGGLDAPTGDTTKTNVLDLSDIPGLEGMERIFTDIANQSQTTARPVEDGEIQRNEENTQIPYSTMVANLIAIGTGNDDAVTASPYFSEKEIGNADALAVVKKSSKRKKPDTFENLYRRVVRGDFTQGSTSEQEQQFTNTYVLTIFDQLKRLEPSFVRLGPGIERNNSKAQTELNYILGGSYKWGSEKFNKRVAELKSKLK